MLVFRLAAVNDPVGERDKDAAADDVPGGGRDEVAEESADGESLRPGEVFHGDQLHVGD